jgi:hypothetical protein
MSMPKERSDPVYRSTLVLTGRDGEMRNFASLEDVPPELRREMEEALHGELAASILLADEAGQNYLSGRVKAAAGARACAGWRSQAMRQLVLEGIGLAALAVTLWLLVSLK